MASPAEIFEEHRDKLERITYAALRIVVGTAFLLHGVQKLAGVWIPAGSAAPEVGSQIWVGGVLELVCGGLIAAGLFTRLAAFLASGQMAVAYIQFHWKFQFDRNLVPINNGGEDALLFCFIFLFFAVKGSGIASVDAMLGRGDRR